MIVIVTGGRDYAGTGLVAELARIHAETQIGLLIVGGATGADTLALRWALDEQERDSATGLGLPAIEVVRADWNRFGRAAGPRRNAEMVALAHARRAPRHHSDPRETILCVAAPGGRGTADCVSKAVVAGIEVRRTA